MPMGELSLHEAHKENCQAQRNIKALGGFLIAAITLRAFPFWIQPPPVLLTGNLGILTLRERRSRLYITCLVALLGQFFCFAYRL